VATSLHEIPEERKEASEGKVFSLEAQPKGSHGTVLEKESLSERWNRVLVALGNREAKRR